MLNVTPYEVKSYPEVVLYRLAKRYRSLTISVFTIAFCWQLGRIKDKHPSKDNYRALLVKADKIEVWHCEGHLKNDRLVFTVETYNRY